MNGNGRKYIGAGNRLIQIIAIAARGAGQVGSGAHLSDLFAFIRVHSRPESEADEV